MVIMSIDQAKKSGVCVFERDEDDYKLIYHDLISSKFENYEDVIIDLSNKIGRLIDEYHPEIILFEDVQNQGSPLTHKNLSMLLGCLIKTCDIKNVQYEIIPCATWRKILRQNLSYHGKRAERKDYKNASKEFVKTKYGLKVNDDIADAISMGSYYIEFKVGDVDGWIKC